MTDEPKSKGNTDAQQPAKGPTPPASPPATEVGGRGGLDPSRYGDWEVGGKCVDF